MRFVGKADGTKYVPLRKSTTPPPPEDNSYYNSPEVIKMVNEEFLSTQRGSVAEIKEMLEMRDYENARRLAHTIKGMAHMMKETKVSSAAQAIEATIYKGGIPTDEQIAELDKQMERVFDKHD
jgi:HPt (histidine-containing phosphotransfer) domain-containing protein